MAMVQRMRSSLPLFQKMLASDSVSSRSTLLNPNFIINVEVSFFIFFVWLLLILFVCFSLCIYVIEFLYCINLIWLSIYYFEFWQRSYATSAPAKKDKIKVLLDWFCFLCWIRTHGILEWTYGIVHVICLA